MRHLNNLTTFIHVAKQESVTKAASRLHLTQQAVSHQIKKLEEELGVILFKRAHKKIFLTPEGREVLIAAEKHLNALEQDMARVQSDKGSLFGNVSISCTTEMASLLLVPIVCEFKKQHPLVNIEIELREDANTVDNIVNGKSDIGIVVFSFNNRLLDICAFRTETFVTVASKHYIALNFTPSEFNQIAALDIVDYQMDCPSMKTWLEKNDKKSAKLLDVKTASVCANDDRVIKDFVMAGVGIANLPRVLVEKELANGEVVEIMPHAQPISAGIDLITMKDRVLPNQVVALFDYINLALNNH